MQVFDRERGREVLFNDAFDCQDYITLVLGEFMLDCEGPVE